jgi:hypothetical protein
MILLVFTIVQGIYVLRATTWPIEKWFGAW